MEEGSVCVLLKRKKQKARPKAKKGVRKREGGFYRNYRDDIDEEGVCIKVCITDDDDDDVHQRKKAERRKGREKKKALIAGV